MSDFDLWIGRIVDQCCRPKPGAALSMDEFEGVVALVATRAVYDVDKPLRELGFTVEGGQILGLRLRTLDDYPSDVSPEGSRSKISRAYVAHLLREGR